MSMLVMGACGIAYEYALGALGNNLIGSSHEQIFVIIGIMMFAMGVGAALQTVIRANLLLTFLGLELALGIVGGSSTLIIYVSYIYTTSYLLLTYVFAISIGIGIGLEIPLIIRINADYAKDLRTNLSQILFMDYVGALLGALLFTYVLLTTLSLGQIALVVGLANTVIAILGITYFWPLLGKARIVLMAVSCLWACGLVAALDHVDGWTATLEQRTFADPIVHSETTRYQHLVLTSRDDDLRLYINGHLQFSSRDEFIYHELLTHVPMAAARHRRRVLILGGGDGLALREVLRYPETQHVTLVDLDPAIIRMARTNSQLLTLNNHAFADARVHTSLASGVGSGARRDVARPSILSREYLTDRQYKLAEVDVLTIDADQFVKHVDTNFDVVLIDLPDPKSLELAKLYSVGFYAALRRLIAPGGVLAVQASSPQRAKDVFLGIGLTLAEAKFRLLPYHDYLPSFGDWGWWLAWKHEETPSSIRSRLGLQSALSVELKYLTPEKLAAVFAFGRNQLKPRLGLLPNTKLRPVLIRYYQRGFESS
jgi:spermidine synthase